MRRITGAGALALAMATVGCSRPTGSSSPAAGADAGSQAIGTLSAEEASQVLARVGDRTITLGDYAAALQHMDQFDRIRYSAPARRRELLGEMIDVMLLADEAREKGYDKDPATEQELREILRDALLKKAREGAPAPADIPAAEVQAYFDAHKGDFHDPERRRVSAIVLATQAAAVAVLESAVRATPVEWGALVHAKSVGASDPTGGTPASDAPADLAGDLGFVSPPGDPRGVNARVPDEVRAAVFEIASPGDVLPRVVPAAGKFYVVKLASKTDARDRTLQDAERSIRVRLAQDKVRAAEDALVDTLRKQYPVELDEAALAQVQVDSPGDSPSSQRSPQGSPQGSPGPERPGRADGGGGAP
jgi:peptidyl-prolyl cis-trans isomerase C